MESSIPSLFRNTAATEAAFRRLLDMVRALPDVELEEKKTCVHFSTGNGAFLGVHPRKQGLRLTVPLARALPADCVAKCEQVSTHRFHNEIDFTDEHAAPRLAEWIEEAYSLKRSS
jgi:hypothetical protein